MTDKTCSPTALLPARVAASKRPIVVVLGMPRSGTSLLTNMLDGLGVELGENLVGADANNQAGYWEQEEICQTQEELLRHLRRRWVDPTGTMPLPSEWWRMPEIQRFKDRLAAIVSAEVSRRDQIWGFKDPRTSRLLPMWQEIFIELKFVPIYLLAIRQPESVVESMAKLYKIPASRVELLWLLHNLDAVRDTGDKLRLVVDYDLWFTQPEKQARTFLDALGLRWNGTTAELLAGVATFSIGNIQLVEAGSGHRPDSRGTPACGRRGAACVFSGATLGRRGRRNDRDSSQNTVFIRRTFR
jgi:hypothetical protein